MGAFGGPNIVEDSIKMYLDMHYEKCFTPNTTEIRDLSSNKYIATFNNPVYGDEIGRASCRERV